MQTCSNKLQNKWTHLFTNTVLHTILDQAFHILDAEHVLLSGLTHHLALPFQMLSYT